MNEHIKIVNVTWTDPCQIATASWMEITEIIEDAADYNAICENTGYILDDNSEYILLASALREDTNMCGLVFKIPKGCILKVEELYAKTERDQCRTEEDET